MLKNEYPHPSDSVVPYLTYEDFFSGWYYFEHPVTLTDTSDSIDDDFSLEDLDA